MLFLTSEQVFNICMFICTVFYSHIAKLRGVNFLKVVWDKKHRKQWNLKKNYQLFYFYRYVPMYPPQSIAVYESET